MKLKAKLAWLLALGVAPAVIIGIGCLFVCAGYASVGAIVPKALKCIGIACAAHITLAAIALDFRPEVG